MQFADTFMQRPPAPFAAVVTLPFVRLVDWRGRLLNTHLSVNGQKHELLLEPRTTLIDCLRDDLGLAGAKRPCDMGNCGSCTVILDGLPVYSCLVLAVDCDGQSITTIEGLANGALHPVQQAFIDCDAMQCGYCTPGQVLAMTSLFEHCPAPSDEEIQHGMSGNLCRCGAYPNIVEAGRQVRREFEASHAPD